LYQLNYDLFSSPLAAIDETAAEEDRGGREEAAIIFFL